MDNELLPVKLADMGAGHDLIGVDVLITQRSVQTTKKGKPYLRLKVRDNTAELPGVMWDYDETRHKFSEGSVIKLWGATDTYQGALQLSVADIGPSDAPIQQFGKCTKFNVADLWGELVTTVDSFTEPMTKWVAEEILLKNAAVADAMQKAPAAKGVHNAWYGGLLEHIVSLCRIASPVVDHYRKSYCDKISKDKVLFGLIMHDAGKIVEYDYNNPAFNLSSLGILTNHIVLGPAWVYEKCNKFMELKSNVPANFKLERAHLMHILASHHGQIEWGSPVRPASIEAILVHHLDNLDSKVMHAWELTQGGDGPIPGFSERSYYEKTPFLKYQD